MLRWSPKNNYADSTESIKSASNAGDIDCVIISKCGRNC